MPDISNEIEIKYDGSKVNLEEFIEWAMSFGPNEFRLVENAIDDYFENKLGYVLRLRRSAGHDQSPELTTKLRTSNKTTVSRVEIDIHPSDSIELLTQFAISLGFSRAISIVKSAHIFNYTKTKFPLSIVIYDVTEMIDGLPLEKTMRIIEIEIEKNNSITPEAAIRYLRTWDEKIKEKFKVDKLNLSLYEIFSGKTYKLKEENND